MTRITLVLLLTIAASPVVCASTADFDLILELIAAGQNEQALSAVRDVVAELEQGRALTEEESTAIDHVVEQLCRNRLVRHDEALQLARLAARLAEGQPDHHITLNNLGIVHDIRREPEDARRCFEQVLALRETVTPPDLLSISNVLNNLSNVLVKLGEYEYAERHRRRTLEIRLQELGPDHIQVIRAREGLASILGRTGHLSEALAYRDEAIEAIGRLEEGDRWVESLLLRHRGGLLLELGRFSDGLADLEQALELQREIWPNPEHPEIARALNSAANAHLDLGDYDSALPLLEEAIEIAKRNEDPFERSMFVGNLGRLEQRRGDLRAALLHFEECIDLLREIPEEYTRADLPTAMTNLGQHLARLHEYDRARVILEEAHRLDVELYGPRHYQVATDLHNLGTLASATGDPELAVRLLSEALELRLEHYGPNHPYVGATLLELAQAQASTNPSEAMTTALHAEEVLREVVRLNSLTLEDWHALRFESVQLKALHLALNLLRENQEPAAVSKVLDGVIRSRASVLSEMVVRVREEQRERSESEAEAWQRFVKVESDLAELRVSPPRDYLERSRELEAELQRLSENLPFADSLRAGLEDVRDSVPNGSVLISYAAFEERIEGKRQTSYLAFVIGDRETPPRVVPLDGVIENDATLGIDDLIDRWRKKCSLDTPEGDKDEEFSDVACRAAGELLRQAVWDPVEPWTSSADVAFIVPDGELFGVSFYGLPVGTESFLIEQGPVLQYLSAERDLTEPTDRPTGDGVFLLASSEFTPGPVARNDEQRIVPDPTRAMAACLSRVVNRSTLPPLPHARVEINRIARLWSEPYRVGGAIALGLAFFLVAVLLSRAARSRAVRLLFALALATVGTFVGYELGDYLSGVRVVTDASANEGSFLDLAPGRRVVHVAAHAYFLGQDCAVREGDTDEVLEFLGAMERGDPLLRSGLILSSFQGLMPLDARGDDGVLTAREIASSDLAGVEVAVLSACNTGLGTVHNGQGSVGLRTAFHQAGVESLVMSLWTVQDRGTSQWMVRFYVARFKNGLTTAHAAREATLAALQRLRQDGLSHPYYWAAFIVEGPPE